MRIGVDAITPGGSLAPAAGGMGHYLASLIEGMSRCAPAHEFVVFESAENRLSLEPLPNVQRIACPGVPRGRTQRVIYQNTVYPGVLRAAQLDVVLGTCNVKPWLAPRPFVVVSQSLQFYRYPRAFGKIRSAYLRFAVGSSLRTADAVIAVSQAAKEEAIECAGVHRNKVHVVHHGIFPAVLAWQSRSAEPKKAANDRYILTVCTLYRYKNVDRLVAAYAKLRRERGITQRLRIIGSDADVSAASLRTLAAKLGVESAVDFMGAVPNSDLPAHYAGADLFVYPSLYETFGIPPLEAMTLGCPVVAARSSSIPEVVGPAAELVDPLDVDDIARGISRVLDDTERRQELVKFGHERVQMFSWERAAEATLQVLTTARDEYTRAAAGARQRQPS